MAPPPDSPVTTAPPAAAPTEFVHRPDPGLARGVWEASPTALYLALAAVLLAAALYLALRLGLARRFRPRTDRSLPTRGGRS